jgi:hypothetical protein
VPAVSDRERTQFVAREMTPRFRGITVVNAQGAWREDRRKVRKKTKLVIVALPETAPDRDRIAAVIDAYKTRFH